MSSCCSATTALPIWRVSTHRVERCARSPAASSRIERSASGLIAGAGNHDWWDDPDAQASGQGPVIAEQELTAAGVVVLENSAVASRSAVVDSGSPDWAIRWPGSDRRSPASMISPP